MLQAPILSPCHVSPWFGLEGEVLGLVLGLEGKVLGLGLGLEAQVIGLGLAGQVLVNITGLFSTTGLILNGNDLCLH